MVNARIVRSFCFLTLSFSVPLFSGCGGGAGGTGTQQNTVTVSGFAVKGPINNADVVINAINADGSIGGVLGSGKTTNDNTGKFAVVLPAPLSGYLAVSVANGSYTSEFNGKSVTCASTMTAIVDSAQTGSAVSVTPVSDMIAQRTGTLIAKGVVPANALNQARQEVMNLYGLKKSPESTIPVFSGSAATISSDPYHLALVLVGMDTFTHQVNPSNPDSVYTNLTSDFADGKLDAMANGQNVQYGNIGNVDAKTLKAIMFTATESAITALANGTSPSNIQKWALANPVKAKSDGVTLPPPGYSCASSYQLINDKNGSPACWDGTKLADGTPIIGSYTVCSADNSLVTDPAKCPSTSGYSCTGSYTLVNDANGHPTCWDGTKSTTGSPYLGTYYVCAVGGSHVATESQCPPSNGAINVVQNSTSPAIFTGNVININKNSLSIAIYQAPTVQSIQASSISSISSSNISSINNIDTSSSLPSYVTSAPLNQAQIDAYNTVNSLIIGFYSY